jgi:hypothetical protein
VPTSRNFNLRKHLDHICVSSFLTLSPTTSQSLQSDTLIQDYPSLLESAKATLRRHLPASRRRLGKMSERKLDEFLKLAKDLSAADIAESLSTVAPDKRRGIFSHPKVSASPMIDDCTHHAGPLFYDKMVQRRAMMYRQTPRARLIDLTVPRRRERHPSTNNRSAVLDVPVLPHATEVGYQDG